MFVQPRARHAGAEAARSAPRCRTWIAQAPKPRAAQGRWTNPLPYAAATPRSAPRRRPEERPRGQGPAPEPAPPTPPAGGARRPRRRRAEQPHGSRDAAAAASQPPPGGKLGEALRNLQKYVDSESFDNHEGQSRSSARIQFDTKGVEFGPWIRRFVAQVRRNWFVPYAAMSLRGHVVITFNVHRNGALTDVTVIGPSDDRLVQHGRR